MESIRAFDTLKKQLLIAEEVDFRSERARCVYREAL